ncbi:hypothetical protein ACHAW5_007379 [Stephanodiscus triporus]|uniref:Methylthioribose-1-phosphate isomerase n=1 Tax=Stephanodiscus triporus TaxID=2934178 RepID=A0ABD3MN90_9STRA
MAAKGNNLRSLIFEVDDDGKASLSVLDQLLLPHETKFVPIENVEGAWDAIRSMRIRGAPLIAIVAVLGLAVDLTSNGTTIRDLAGLANSFSATREYIYDKMAYLTTSRPTAVNLSNAMVELRDIVEKMSPEAPVTREIVGAIVDHGRHMLARDVSDNVAIGRHGADDLLSRHDRPDGVRLVTICNTGSLATAGWGTALGVARELHRRGRLESIACLETRPYNQGSRLTAYEIREEGMNGTLICDSMAAFYMRRRGADACVVGADRVCANGDTANKVGTYALAIIAREMGVEFFVASPFTTLDVDLSCGDDIEIEERPPGEMLESACAPKDMPCWNPGFDVTPAEYITGIITERGVLKKSSDGTFDVIGFVREHSS